MASPVQQRTFRSLQQAAAERPWTTVRYLRRLIYERRIPYSKVGGRLLVALEDLDALAEAGLVEASN